MIGRAARAEVRSERVLDPHSLLDAPNAVVRMRSLPPFQGRPAWARFDHDEAIGNFAAALGRGDRMACLGVAVAASLAAFDGFSISGEPRTVMIAEGLLRLLEQAVSWPGLLKHLRPYDIDASSMDGVEAWLVDAVHHTQEVTRNAPTVHAAIAAVCSVRALVARGVPIETAVLSIARACVARRRPDR